MNFEQKPEKTKLISPPTVHYPYHHSSSESQITISEKTKEDPHLSGTKTEFHTAEKQQKRKIKKQKIKKHQRDHDSVRRATDLAPCTLTPQNTPNANANANANPNSQTQTQTLKPQNSNKP